MTRRAGLTALLVAASVVGSAFLVNVASGWTSNVGAVVCLVVAVALTTLQIRHQQRQEAPVNPTGIGNLADGVTFRAYGRAEYLMCLALLAFLVPGWVEFGLGGPAFDTLFWTFGILAIAGVTLYEYKKFREHVVELTTRHIRCAWWESALEDLGADWGAPDIPSSWLTSSGVYDLAIPWDDVHTSYREKNGMGIVVELTPAAPLPPWLSKSKKRHSSHERTIMLVTRREASLHELHEAFRRYAGDKYEGPAQ
ncbi:hypothetical protein [Micromonospora echinofusca]|uniref:hypothetical protein n=1 Tax=Micromonospora echinofusca TaxID=47858 RepID=UPI0033EBF280